MWGGGEAGGGKILSEWHLVTPCLQVWNAPRGTQKSLQNPPQERMTCLTFLHYADTPAKWLKNHPAIQHRLHILHQICHYSWRFPSVVQALWETSGSQLQNSPRLENASLLWPLMPCWISTIPARAERLFNIQRKLVQPGTLLKGQLCAIHSQTAMPRRACLIFLVQLPNPHVSLL